MHLTLRALKNDSGKCVGSRERRKNMEAREIIEQFENNIEDDFISYCYNTIEDIEGMIEPFFAVEPLLLLMERNPDINYGMSGPIVHFVEKFYGNGYEEMLVDSIKRKPTKHTLWMLNRVINGSSGEVKKECLNMLTDITSDTDLCDESIRNEAQVFLTSHLE